jgi:mono/diheme cytochrome c family protein
MIRGVCLGIGTVFCLAVAQPAVAQGAKVERGQVVYTEQKCSVCHSIDGVGNRRGPLDEVGLKYTAEELRAWLLTPREMEKKTGATRKPSKRPYTGLPADDLDALVAYLQTLKKKH